MSGERKEREMERSFVALGTELSSVQQDRRKSTIRDSEIVRDLIIGSIATLPFVIGDDFVQSFNILPNLGAVVMPQQFTFPDSTAHRQNIGALHAFRFPVKNAVAFPLVTIPERFDLAAVFVGDLGHQYEDCTG